MVNFPGVGGGKPIKESPVGVGTFQECEGLRNIADNHNRHTPGEFTTPTALFFVGYVP